MENYLDRIEIEPGKGFPVVRNLWDFFSTKGSKVVFVTLGEETTPLVELHISENLGCKIHVFESNREVAQKWEDLSLVLKTRKTTEQTPSFAASAIKRWVLPTNVLVYPWIPHFQSGSENLKTTLDEICKPLGETRIDILKAVLSEKTVSSLYAMLHYGFRPGLLFLQWESSPDAATETTLLAGHLQCSGYALMFKENNNYLYFYNDKCAYEVCSWENYVVENPMIAKFFELAALEKTTLQK